MREGKNEIEVLNLNNHEPYVEEFIFGKWVIGVKSNDKFMVKVTLYRERNDRSRFSFVKLRIDGRTVGSGRIFIPEKSDFCRLYFAFSYGSDNSRYYLKFGKIETETSDHENLTNDGDAQNKIGLISVIVTEAEPTEAFKPKHQVIESPSLSAVNEENQPLTTCGNGKDEKKLINLPSVQTIRGERLTENNSKEGSSDPEPYCRLWRSIEPLQQMTLNLYYHEEKFVKTLKMIEEAQKTAAQPSQRHKNSSEDIVADKGVMGAVKQENKTKKETTKSSEQSDKNPSEVNVNEGKGAIRAVKEEKEKEPMEPTNKKRKRESESDEKQDDENNHLSATNEPAKGKENSHHKTRFEQTQCVIG
jgi:hypothetical protein